MDAPSKRNARHIRNRKARRAARQMVRKLIENGSKNKREYRQKLSLKYGKANQTQIKMSIKPKSVQPCIIFGAMNVNTMDLEVA